MYNLRYFKIIAAIAISFGAFLNACKTPNNSQGNIAQRFYHNNTARYNGYFNARTLYQKTVGEFEKKYPMEYSGLLPILKLPSASQKDQFSIPMEEIIKKSSKIIDRHKISKWTDDCFMLVGKSYFYKGNYYDAAQAFDYVYLTFPDKDLKEEALAWSGLSKMRDGLNEAAEATFDIALANVADAKNSRSFVYAAASEFYFNQKKYDKCSANLEGAIASLKKDEEEERSRYSFILGQLLEKNNQFEKAMVAYDEIGKSKVPYEMKLSAQINSLRLATQIKGENSKQLSKHLYKLLNDEKNIEYQGQIFYVLGVIEERNNRIDSAIKLYTKSSFHSENNPNQKAIAYKQIANIYFSHNRNFKTAKVYYDSTRMFLSEENSDYQNILERSNKLNELSVNYLNIAREDSLQALAKLPTAEQERIVNEKASKIFTEFRQANNSSYSYSNNANMERLNNTFASAENNWYFYNTSALSAGFNEFTRRWGNRALTDNWRISSKQTASSAFSSSQNFKLSNNANIDTIKLLLTKDIPNTPALLDSSNSRLQKAHYNLGNIYFNDLEDYSTAAKEYQLAFAVNPKATMTAEVLYNLHTVYIKQGESNKAGEYAALLINNHPNSPYTQALKNAEKQSSQIQKPKVQDLESEDLFEKAYADLKNEDYASVIAANNAFQSSNASKELKSKFAFIAAIATGRTQKVDSFIASLNNIKKEFEGEEVADRADKMISVIESQKAEFASRPVAIESSQLSISAEEITANIKKQEQLEREIKRKALEEAESKSYFKKATPESKYVVVVAINHQTLNLNRIRFGIGQFNKKLYASKNYQHASSVINNETQLIAVNSFTELPAVIEYFKNFKSNKSEIIPIPDSYYEIFIITNDNFARLTDQKKVQEYKDYFRNNFNLY